LDDAVESEANNSSWVLEEHQGGSTLLNDVKSGGPEPSIIRVSPPPSGHADGLAGRASNDDIHRATPCASVEGAGVIPDRRIVNAAITDAGLDESLTLRVKLDVADGTGRDGEGNAPVETEAAAKEAEGT
jgi:hypothetical protein